MTCADFEDHLADLAAGGVAEPLRSRLLAHARDCAPCTSALAEVVALNDALAHLAPEVEPPEGFETRVLARTVGDGDDARRSRLHRVSALAAAAAVFVVGIIVGFAAAEQRRVPEAEAASAAVVALSGERIGTADIYSSAGAARIVLTMADVGRWDGEWACQLRLGDGQWVEVGRWTHDDVTAGVWAAGIPPALAEASEMRILGRSGRAIATAKLAGGAPG